MAKMSMKQFESSENQQKLRDRLIEKAKKNALSQESMSKILGISPITLNRFWRQVRDVDFRTLSIIEGYVDEADKV